MSDLSDFLDALFGASQSPIRLTFEEDSEREVQSGEDIAAVIRDAGEEPIYAFPEMADGRVAFVYEASANAHARAWEGYIHQPTVALFNGSTMISIWAFSDPVGDDPAGPLLKVVRIAKTLNTDLGEPVPTPGSNGWEMVRCDPNAFYEVDALWEAFVDDENAPIVPAHEPEGDAPPWEEDLGTYGDATILTRFDDAEPAYARPMIISVGAGRDSTSWKSQTMPIGQFVATLCRHPENAKKDGLSFVLADIVGGNRRKVAVKACYGVGLDIDVGTSGAQIDAELAKLGCLAVRYTTHSHGKARTQIRKDRLIKAADKAGRDLDEAFILDFLRTDEHWDEAVVETVEYVGDEHQPEGLMVMLNHAPMPKHRVVVPFAEPFVISEVAKTQDEAMRLWTQVPKALALLLGDLPLDKSGVDPSRLFYFPRHAKGKPWEESLFGGPLLDWRTLDLEDKPANEWDALVQEFDKGKGKSQTDAGKKLGRWSIKRAGGFQIVDVLRDHAEDRIRTNGSTKIDIECPFDEEHSNPGDPEDRACMAVNAGDGPSSIFTIKCQHDSCSERTNLDMLGKMIADQWFGDDVLEDEQYNALADDEPATPEAAKIEREDVARDGFQHLIEALTPESPTEDVESAVRAVIEANMSSYETGRAENAIRLKIKTTQAILGRLVKQVKASMKKEGKDVEAEKDPLGRDIFAYTGDYHFDEAYLACFRVMKEANREAGLPLYSCLQDKVMRLREASNGRITFEEITPRGLWAELNERLTFVRKFDGAESLRGPVPREVADHVYETAYQRLPQTPEIIYTPLYTEDCTLVTEPGWYERMNLIMANTGFEVAEVPSGPAQEDVDAAVKWLRGEVLIDFPFLDTDLKGNDRRDPAEANAMAMILTPFMRRMIKSCTPVFFISKPAPGTGGTFLAKVPMVLFDGQESTPLRYTQNEEEMQKALLASIMDARSHLFYDDVKEFNSRSLLQSLTAKNIGGRLLGSTRTVERPNRFNWVSTGNNPIVGSEMERRICWIRLNALTADVQKRVYKHDNYEQFLLDTRDITVFHILVLIENWIAKGMPLFKDRKRASFEDWSEKVGGVLMCAGVEGFLDNSKRTGSDAEETAIRQFVREWLKRFQYEAVTSAKLLEHAIGIDADVLEGNNDDQKKQRFHKKMLSLSGRVFDLDKVDYLVTLSSDADGALTYSLSMLKDTEDETATAPIAA